MIQGLTKVNRSYKKGAIVYCDVVPGYQEDEEVVEQVAGPDGWGVQVCVVWPQQQE
jgi:hypothetical protein